MKDRKIDELFFTLSIKKRATVPTLKPGFALRNLRSAAQHHPQVIVKIPKRKGKSNGLSGIKTHLDYISRNGLIEIEDDDGNIYSGHEGKKEIVDFLSGIAIQKQSKKREAINFVFSMPPGTEPKSVCNAVRTMAKEQFPDHYYFFALHTDEAHPHVHLCLIVRDKNGIRINPKKADLIEYRLRFAEHLREKGVECTATYRSHLGKNRRYQNSIVEHIKKRGGDSYIAAQKSVFHLQDLEKLKAIRSVIREKYNTLIQSLVTDGKLSAASDICLLKEKFTKESAQDISRPELQSNSVEYGEIDL